MADEIKPKADGTNISPTPESGETKPANDQTPPDPNVPPEAKASGGGGPAPTVPADPLADGTVPTVLSKGESHRPVPKGKTSITSIYRKADITTTLITFVVAVVVSGAAVGIYAYLTRAKAPNTKPPAVTSLSKSDLDKLGAYFEGNTAGTTAETLTISPTTLFKNRVALNSDLKVIGGLEVDGTTTLGNLSATKTTNLGVTNVGGQLTVNGPLTVQNPALFNAGATYKGNVSASGNGSFGGTLSAASISVQDLSVNGTLNINGHINIGGLTPTASPDQAAGSGATASVAGNDSAGTVTVSTGTVTGNANLGGDLVKVTFRNTYPSVPTIVISPDGRGAAQLQPYVLKSANWFIVEASFDALSHTSYSFDYWVAQ
ncbi:MAG TPA: hypothetical protein VHQ86_01890 [Candidatus Saccharimonadia bacterium]|nr:hypothetical protein [Candidatus Saccharimonadia bacterium]